MLKEYGYACVVNERICFPINQTEAGARDTLSKILALMAIEDAAVDATTKIIRVVITEDYS